jgi:hypothetical protein
MAFRTAVASSTQTANFVTAAISIGGGTANITIQPVVTATAGTSPSLALQVQWSLDGINFGTPDPASDSFAAITAVGSVVKQLPVRAPYYRLSATVTGTTPSFTLSFLDSTNFAI